MYLIVDCETNRLPDDWRAPITCLDNWPRAVQIAWAAYDAEQREIASACHIIRPEGWEVTADALRVHGITTARAAAEGRPVRDVLRELQEVAAGARHIISHNARFDGSVLAAEYLRQEWQPPFDPSRMICTMEGSTAYCRLPGGRRGYKWPRLDELHWLLFGEFLTKAHDAQHDVAACARCFFELVRRGVIVLR